jgi:hypothetical protein
MSTNVLLLRGPNGPVEAQALSTGVLLVEISSGGGISAQEFVAYLNGSGAGGASNYAQMCVFNPVGSGKSVLVHRILYYDTVSTGAADVVSFVSVDPNLGTNVTPLNMQLIGGAVSVAHVSFIQSTTTLPGTAAFISGHDATSKNVDMLATGQIITLPPGSGVVFSLYLPATGTHFYGINFFWQEV